MIARAHTFTVEGLDVHRVTVEVDVRRGLPAFTIVGLADAAVREARERVRTAILNSGFEFPSRRVTANLSPAAVPKSGPGLDLALACAILAAVGQLPQRDLDRRALLGELALDGSLRGVSGTLAIAEAATRSGLPELVLADTHAHEARLLPGLAVAGVRSLGHAVAVLRGHTRALAPSAALVTAGEPPAAALDLADVRGQHAAVRALVLAAAGGHNLLLSGAPGTGKTMLARRLVSILPPLSTAEAIEVARVESIAGAPIARLAGARPFRAPHHSITAAGLVGGAHPGRVGEIVRAHNGILFLDELSQFARPALDALREPLEDGRVSIVRSGHASSHPARFMLVAATNPCACSHGTAAPCSCGEADLARRRRVLSGPLLDRIDLLVRLERDHSEDLSAPALTSTGHARERVIAARERQAARRGRSDCMLNAQLEIRGARATAGLDERGELVLRSAVSRGSLSGRGQLRVLQVARTLADLDGRERIRARDVSVAIALRGETTAAAADAHVPSGRSAR